MSDLEKNVILKNASGDSLFPKTKGSLVYNNSNQNLGTVEAGAQVNLIESITVNGNAVSIVNKQAQITVEDSVYTIAKKATAETGYAASYYLTKDGNKVGEYINIPKDMVVESGTLRYCETADTPVEGLQPGDPYIDLVIANADSSHIYIPVKGLVDIYTAGNGLDLNNGQFSVDTTDTTIVDANPTANSTKFVQSGGVYSQLATKQNVIDASNKLDADLVDDATSTHKFVSEAEKTNWSGKQDAITATNKLSADLVQAGSTNAVITLTEKAGYDGLDAAKADKATTLAGYGITDGITYVEIA